MAQTRIALINFALDQTGLDSSYQTKARTWLNIILDKLYTNKRYPFSQTVVDGLFVADQKTYSLPADFVNADTLYNVNASGQQGSEIFIYDSYTFEPYNSDARGMPYVAMIDDKNNTIVFNSAPSSPATGSYRLRYFCRAPQYSTDSTDDSTVITKPSQDVLINELIKIGMKHLDDERYPQQAQETLEANRQAQRAMYQSDTTSSINLAHTHFRGRRRSYRGGW